MKFQNKAFKIFLQFSMLNSFNKNKIIKSVYLKRNFNKIKETNNFMKEKKKC